MKQTNLNLDPSNQRKRMFLDAMEREAPWQQSVALVAPHAPTKATGRRLFPIEAMLRIRFIQQWSSTSDFAMEEALQDCRCIANLSAWVA